MVALADMSDSTRDMTSPPSARDAIARAAPSITRGVDGARRHADALAASTATHDAQGNELARRPKRPNEDRIIASALCCDGSMDNSHILLSGSSNAKDVLNSSSTTVLNATVKQEERKGRVDVLDIAVQEACDRDGVAQSIHKAIPRFERCYERALAKDSSLHGQLRMSVQVNERGRAASAEILEHTFSGDEVASCARDTLRRLSYPRVLCSFTSKFEFEPVMPRDDP